MRVMIEDLEVLWPYDFMYPEQYNYMCALYQSLSSGHCLLEMPTGTGKCWARGTMLRLYNGEKIAVEDVIGGEKLMGDDGLPRTVTPGSFTHGRATMYNIIPAHDGAEAFTVNGDHILVLAVNAKPIVKPCKVNGKDGFDVVWFHLDDNATVARTERGRKRKVRDVQRMDTARVQQENANSNSLQSLLQSQLQSKSSQSALADSLFASPMLPSELLGENVSGSIRHATVKQISQRFTVESGEGEEVAKGKAYALKAQLEAKWEPIEWEVSVDDFLSSTGDVRHVAMLVASKAVTFQSQHLTLRQVLSTFIGHAATCAQVHWAAWYLGIWVTDGTKKSDIIYQGEPPEGEPTSHFDIVVRLHQYEALFGEPVKREFDKRSSAGHIVYRYKFGVDRSGRPSVARALLNHYRLIHNKHVPHALLCDTIEVRQWFLAGVIDGDGYYTKSDNVYELQAKHKRLALGYKELVASLGLWNGRVHTHNYYNEDKDKNYDGWRVFVSGPIWSLGQLVAATCKRCPAPGEPDHVNPNNESRCYGFSIEQLNEDEYFGFAVHGGANRRFLLADFTITHNTVSLLALILAYQYHRQQGKGKLIYCTRTVQEMDKVVEELKRITQYREQQILETIKATAPATGANDSDSARATELSIAVSSVRDPRILGVCLSSRRNLCIHPDVSAFDNRAKVDSLCRNLTASFIREARAAGNESLPHCEYFEGFEKDGRDASLLGVYSLADLKVLGCERGWCPYFFARHAINAANVVVYNYQYMLDPKISGLVSRELEASSIVVFDEAHNIDNICLAAGSHVALADGTAWKIEDMGSLPQLLAFRPAAAPSCGEKGDGDDDSAGCIAARPSVFLRQGERECVELLFSDGRTLVCTPDHRILCDDAQWVQAQHLVLGQSRCLVTCDPPVVDWQETVRADATAATPFRLTLSGQLQPLTLQDEAHFRVTSAFLRLLGYLLTDGTASAGVLSRMQIGMDGDTSLCLSHLLDCDSVRRDIELITGTHPSVVVQRNMYRVSMPKDLAASLCMYLGGSIGNRSKQATPMPAFLTDPHCPLPVLREFLGGLFGGNGCSVAYRHHQKTFSAPRFSQLRVGRLVAAAHAELILLQQMMGRFGITNTTIKVRTHSDNKASVRRQRKRASKQLVRTVELSEILPSAMYIITLSLHADDIVPFNDNIGFRHCCHKQMRLAAAAAFCRHRITFSRQYQAICDKALAYHIAAASPESHWRPSITRTVQEVGQTELLMPQYEDINALAETTPLMARGIMTKPQEPARSDLALKAKDALAAFGIAQFFSERRWTENLAPATSEDEDEGDDDSNDEDDEHEDYEEVEVEDEEGEANEDEDDASAKVRYGVSRACDSLPVFHLTVVGRRSVGLRQTFDLSVPQLQSFVANGLVVHNCIEALSVTVDARTVNAASHNVESLKRKVRDMERTDAARLQQEYNNLLQGLQQSQSQSEAQSESSQSLAVLTDSLSASPVLPSELLRESVPGNIRRAKHFLAFLRSIIEYAKHRLQLPTVSQETPAAFLTDLQRATELSDPRALKFCFDRLQSLFRTLRLSDLDEYTPLSIVANFATVVSTYAQGFAIIFEPFDERTPAIADPKLQLCCLDASIAIKPVFERFHSVVITSGTLSPLDVYPRVLNFHPAVVESLSMSLSRAVICPMIVTKGSDQVPISSKFDLRADVGVIQNYGRLLLEVCSVVPDGVVGFFTSYRYMEDVIAAWQELGVIDQLLAKKLIFIETKDIVETTLALNSFKRACEVGRGALFLSVARGKVAEGIDFDRHYGRCVLIFGIPFQYTLSRVLRARLQFLQEEFQLSEADFLVFDAMRQCAQCVGRVIRSKNDYGLMIFADARFARTDRRNKLPKWITQFLNQSNLNLSTDRAISIAREFLRLMAQPREKNQEIGVTMLNEQQLHDKNAERFRMRQQQYGGTQPPQLPPQVAPEEQKMEVS